MEQVEAGQAAATVVVQPASQQQDPKRKWDTIISVALASGPVLLLALASINQLTVRDSILSCLFMAGIIWYLSRMRLTSAQRAF